MFVALIHTLRHTHTHKNRTSKYFKRENTPTLNNQSQAKRQKYPPRGKIFNFQKPLKKGNERKEKSNIIL